MTWATIAQGAGILFAIGAVLFFCMDWLDKRRAARWRE